MLELYFLFYRIPRMMTKLARERNRSAVRWSLIGIAAWIGAEVAVAFAIGAIHGIGIVLWGWSEQAPGVRIATYILALGAALMSVSVVSRILTGKPREESFQVPPPPPEFQRPEHKYGE